jgi:hypothetical protein
MKKIVGLAALLLTGVAAPAFATTTVDAPATTDCTGPEHVWQNFGAAPFAQSEAEAMRRLPEVLDRMVAFGCMTRATADHALTVIRANPGGLQGERLPVLNAGTRFVYSESKNGPNLNVVIGESYVQRGVVAGVQMRAWSFRDQQTGKIYTIFLPLVCWNWSLQVVVASPPPPPPPAPPEPECVVSNRVVRGRTDGYVHIGGDRVDLAHECTGWRYQGETEWRQITNCDTDCYYGPEFRAVMADKVGNADMTFAMKVPVKGDGVIQVRLERRALEPSAGIALFDCLELLNGLMSDSVYTRYDDYHYYAQWNQNIATVFRTEASIPADWSERRLYFRFSSRQ